MKKLYLAGPMRNVKDFNFPEFHRAAADLRSRGYFVFNPAEHDEEKHGVGFNVSPTGDFRDIAHTDFNLRETLNADLTWIAMHADGIALLPGWEKSKGATAEHALAVALGIDVMYLNDPQLGMDRVPSRVVTTSDPVNRLADDILLSPTIARVENPENTAYEYMKTQPVNGSKPTNPKDALGVSKLPMHLWPKTATALGSLALLDGALKYGRANWRVIGVRASIYYDALDRHISRWFEGEDNDTDSGLPHLAHALACIAILVDSEAAGVLVDDRQVQGGFLNQIVELTPHVKRLQEKYADLNPRHYTIADVNKTISTKPLDSVSQK